MLCETCYKTRTLQRYEIITQIVNGFNFRSKIVLACSNKMLKLLGFFST